METSITKYSERGNTIYYTVEFVIDGISGRTEKRWNDFGSLKDVLRKLNKKVYDKAASMKGFSSKPEKRQVQLAGFLSKIFGVASTDAERAAIRAFFTKRKEAQAESGRSFKANFQQLPALLQLFLKSTHQAVVNRPKLIWGNLRNPPFVPPSQASFTVYRAKTKNKSMLCPPSILNLMDLLRKPW